jgi:VanZ family protein
MTTSHQISVRQLRLFFWRFLALACAAQVLCFSGESFGSGHTRSVLAGIIKFLGVSALPQTIDVVNGVLRKLAHLTEYTFFSFSVFNSLGGREQLCFQKSLPVWCIAATAALSLLDEFHQAFVPGRTAALSDCALDCTGSAVMMLFVCGFALRKRQQIDVPKTCAT